MRPAEFRRGMSEKDRASAVMVDRSVRASAARAVKPGREVPRIRAMPSATSARFSGVSGIMSDTVPSAATSVKPRHRSGMPRRAPSTCTSFRATPAPASSRLGPSAASLGSATGTPSGTRSAGS